MSAVTRIVSATALTALLFAGSTAARESRRPTPVPLNPTGSAVSLDHHAQPALRRAAATPDTTILGSWTFDGGGGGCISQGWTSVDRTAQTGTYFHVDDFAGLGGGDFGRLVPLEGAQSMWCGARPSTTEPLCGYATLPGYGNHWIQTFETDGCVTVTGDASVDFLVAWDSEPGYDYTALDVVECGVSWPAYTPIAGGRNEWDDVGGGFFSVTIHDSLFTDSLRVRFRFESDPIWSDEDGLYDSDGAVILDSLTVRDSGGVVLPTETFESETAGATVTLSGNWRSGTGPAAGDFAALFPGATVLQEDPCVSNLTCFWGFFSGSTYDYSCGGHPEQTAVTRPLQSEFGDLYIDNDIRSPWFPLAGSGNTFELAFDVYRDLNIDASIFYVWRVRFSDGGGGCSDLWYESPYPYFGNQKDWFRFVADFSRFVPPGATYAQVAIGVIDYCGIWGYCNFGEYCRSQAPLIDNVEVRRIDSNGPRWAVYDFNLFQDNFASDGTTTGTVRADAALDLMDWASPTIRPGDSVAVHVFNPEGRLAADPYTGMGSAVYAYVNVHPLGQAGKQGAALSSDAWRWPVVDSLLYAGETWYTIRMDSAFTGGEEPDTAFCVDLNDNLFTPGDTVFYFFGAIGDMPAVEATYYSRFTGTTDDMAYAASNPMEFTCLPTLDANVYYPIWGQGMLIRPSLYVDFADGRGVQPAFDAAFEELGIAAYVDRYDVLSPSSLYGNSPSGRVVDVAGQLIPAYRRIIWSTGDLKSGVLGSAYYGGSYKYDDAGILKTFLDLLPDPGGVYFTGDDLAEEWNRLSGSAVTLRDTYMQFSLTSGDHAVTYGVSPLVEGASGGIFDHAVEDTWVAYGGCPSVSDFDVLAPAGPATTEATYGGGPGSAVLAQSTDYRHVVLSGFSFDEIRSVTSGGQPATPAHVMWDILMFLDPTIHTGTGDTTPRVNSLSQNVPNPFNPSTTIDFTVKDRAPVTLRIYNVRGQRVRTLVDDTRAPGIAHRITWDGTNDAGQRVASGVYFYRLATKGFTTTRKMVLLK